jgi:hypothetical protein
MGYPIRITNDNKDSLKVIENGFNEFVNSLDLHERKIS